MKRVPRIVLMGFMIAFCFGGVVRIYAETVQVVGDYNVALATTVDGDLIVTNGSIVVAPGAALTVNGDVKVTSGSVFVGNGNLQVFGDIIVTNTLLGGSASIIVNGDLEVGGSLLARSDHGDAYVSTTGASQNGTIAAESITTRGDGKAIVYSLGSMDVVGEIDTRSATGDAFVESIESTIYAGSIVTSAYEDANVRAVSSASWILVIGEIVTQSVNHTAAVAADNTINAGSITTHGKDDSSVGAHSIDIKGTLRTKSSNSSALVSANDGTLIAGAIITEGYTDSNVNGYDSIEVRGDIVTESATGKADVFSDQGSIVAANIVTRGYGLASVRASGLIDVRRDIWTYSENNSADVTADYMQPQSIEYEEDFLTMGARNGGGDSISAYRITTNALLGAWVKTTNGFINVKGPINTKGDSAHVETWYGDIEAESIFTEGNETAHVRCNVDGSILVKDVIKTKASVGYADVKAYSDLKARSIETSAGGANGHVEAIFGSIDVAGDIRTYAPNGEFYVHASQGNIKARSIQTKGDESFDDSIKAAAGSGHFQWFPNPTDPEILIKDSEFYFDTDHDWVTTLSIEGTCVLNGNGHQLRFDDGGGIYIRPGSSLMLKNIILDNISGIVVQCEDDTGVLSLHNVTWTQTSDTQFSKGSLQIFGDCVINGPGTKFTYESSQTSTIHENSTFLIAQGVTFNYDTAGSQLIWMVDPSSQFSFNGGLLFATQDLRLMRGTLVFENKVDFTADTSKTIYFGDGALAANNIALDYHLKSQWGMFGTLVNDNV